MMRFILRFCNGLITFAVILVLIVSAAYAGYALWDNEQVYNAVENTMDELREIRALMDAPRTKTGIETLIASRATAAKAPEPTPQPVETAVIPAADAETQTGIPENTAVVPAVNAETQTSVPEDTTATPAADAETQTGIPENTAVVPATDAETQASVPENTAQTFAAAEETPAVKVTAIPTEMPTEVPTEEPVDDSPFGQLLAINPDITAWITMPGTAIDYPVLQGKSNITYINKNVYKEFAIAGSIFLDTRNDRTYQDIYSLLYGHNMSKHRMFSDVNLYKDKDFFNENRLGMLITEDGGHLLQTLSCILTSAGNSSILNPDNWTGFTNKQQLAAILEDAVQVDQETLEILKAKMDADEPYHIVALSTCSGEFTDARTILLTLMDP